MKPHLTYSPDMAPSDFYLFPKLKRHLRGTQYVSNEGVINAANEYLGGGRLLRKLEQRWYKCVALKGDYIEKYRSNFHASSQSLRFILSLRLYSSFITSRPGSPCDKYPNYVLATT